MRQMAGEHHRRRIHTTIVAAEQRDALAAAGGERGDRAVAGLERADANGVGGDARLRKRFRADEDRERRIARAARARQRQVHRRRFVAQARGDVGSRRQLAGRRLLGEHDSRVDEIDRAVAVAVLERAARLEEVAERRRSNGVARRRAAHGARKRDEEKNGETFHGDTRERDGRVGQVGQVGLILIHPLPTRPIRLRAQIRASYGGQARPT